MWAISSLDIFSHYFHYRFFHFFLRLLFLICFFFSWFWFFFFSLIIIFDWFFFSVFSSSFLFWFSPPIYFFFSMFHYWFSTILLMFHFIDFSLPLRFWYWYFSFFWLSLRWYVSFSFLIFFFIFHWFRYFLLPFCFRCRFSRFFDYDFLFSMPFLLLLLIDFRRLFFSFRDCFSFSLAWFFFDFRYFLDFLLHFRAADFLRFLIFLLIIASSAVDDFSAACFSWPFHLRLFQIWRFSSIIAAYFDISFDTGCLLVAFDWLISSFSRFSLISRLSIGAFFRLIFLFSSIFDDFSRRRRIIYFFIIDFHFDFLRHYAFFISDISRLIFFAFRFFFFYADFDDWFSLSDCFSLLMCSALLSLIFISMIAASFLHYYFLSPRFSFRAEAYFL